MPENTMIPAGVSPKEFTEWMRRMEASSEQQKKYMKKQYTLTMLRTICSMCILLVIASGGILVVPKAISTVNRVDTLMDDMKSVVKNLDAATEALSKADLTKMLDEVGTLVQESQTGVEEAIKKISALDIDTMNEAIADLKAVVEPMAKLFGR